MKRFLSVILISLILLTSCAKKQTVLDLTKISQGFAYEQVTSILQSPEEYIGKRIRVQGYFDIVHSDYTNKDYYYCVVQDVTVCCQQGIEFIWDGVHLKEDYPETKTDIVIEGKFGTYYEDGQAYHYIAAETLETVSGT